MCFVSALHSHCRGHWFESGMLQQLKGLTPENGMAFGDYLNDLELLENVSVSYAMGNALDAIKRVARHIAPGNDENGVMRVLRGRFAL